MADIKLYGYCTSPFVRKTAAFLYFKGVDFDHIPVNPVDASKTLGKFGGTQVPVLEIDEEWRRESSDHAYWLDELFPNNPLCPPEHRETVERIDRWISGTFLMAFFRGAIDGPNTVQTRFRFWRLAALVSSQTPMPEEVRNSWPDFVRQAPFIRAMAEHMDLTESIPDMQARIGLELIAHLGDGPFLGGLPEPTMLDLALFPQIVFGAMAGLEDGIAAASVPVLKAWLRRVAERLPTNPILVPDYMLVKRLDHLLA